MRRSRLVAHPKRVAKHSWSFWLAIFGFACSAAEVRMGVIAGSPPIAPVPFALCLPGVSLAGAVARLVAQPALAGGQ